MLSVITRSAAETVALGARLGRLLDRGDVVTLTGELGAGKTQFAKGVAEGLAVDPGIPVTSPTFTILNVYQGRVPFYHFDLYRLDGDADLVELGLTDYLLGDGVCVVEWAERLVDEMPGDRLEISFSHEAADARRIELRGHGARYGTIMTVLFPEQEKNALTGK